VAPVYYLTLGSICYPQRISRKQVQLADVAAGGHRHRPYRRPTEHFGTAVARGAQAPSQISLHDFSGEWLQRKVVCHASPDLAHLGQSEPFIKPRLSEENNLKRLVIGRLQIV